MRRLQLVELHEQPWFPEIWRSMFRRGLGRSQRGFGIFDNAVPKVLEMFESTECRRILDLCSGSGEATVTFLDLMLESDDSPRPMRFVLSDLFPEVDEFRRRKEERPGLIDYREEPVNALRPPDLGPHFRSMFSSLHHFRPDQVREILQDAAEVSEGIFILEGTSRSWKSLLYCLPLPLVGSLVTGFLLRPWRPVHLLWGLLVPVLPAVVMFDSIVSTLRSYTTAELTEILRSLDTPDFVWRVGTVPVKNLALQTTYILGKRVEKEG